MIKSTTPPRLDKAETLLETARAYYGAGLFPLPRVIDHDEPSYITLAGDVHSIAWGQSLRAGLRVATGTR